ncbi:YncE family protein [Tannerella sp.]|uniref:YncE family protein n=1 Tax=Tannerella sp. TaxID=2382127 RepID=UPI003FA31D83
MERRNLKIRSLLFSVCCMLAIGLSFTSCDNDEGDSLIDTGSTLTLPKTRVFILNEGKMGNNNAGMAFYAPNKDADFVADIFMKQNKKGLGDTGQDIILYKNHMYVSLHGSQVLLKLNSAGVEEKRVAFSKSDGAPRQLVADNGKIYVTLYSGKMAKIDATTLDIEGYVEVGRNPEGIAKDNGYLYVVNSGWGQDSTMTVIDKKAFAVSKTIIVAKNPQRVLESEGQIFVQGNGGTYPNYTYPVQKVDVAKGMVTTIANATHLCEHKGILYMVYGDTDWKTYKTTNTFSSYNVKTGTLNKTNFLTNMPEKLGKTSVYMMEVNPNNGDIYIGTSSFTENGTIYRFDRNGKFIEQFESGGINPNHAVFFN